MNLNDFISNFSNCFNRTPATDIKAETEFKKIDEWSSILALIVIAMVDSDYQKVLTADDIRNATTVQDIYELLIKK
jgi:acyl carrier protein